MQNANKKNPDPRRGIIFISNVTKAMEHEWFVEYVDKNKFTLEFVLFNSKGSELYHAIKNSGFKCLNYPFRSNYFLPLYILRFSLMLMRKKPDFVHCHLFQASLIGILAAKLAGIPKRIYTRHHADVHHVYHPHAVKYDKLVNRYSTHIIAVSKNSAAILMKYENVPASKITVINHGIPLKLIDKKISEEEIKKMALKYALSDHIPVVGVISRFVPEKGIQYIIPAFKKLLADFPEALLILANARGKYESQIRTCLQELPPSSFLLIPFESNVDPLFKNFDVFVHAPIDGTCEAFGQVYIETLSLGVPMVCTISGIAHDLVVHERNALVADYKSDGSLYIQMKRMLSDRALKEKIVAAGKEDVKAHTFEIKFEKIMAIYLS